MGTFYYGDNLQILREHVKSESVDLVYLDPPFNSNASYNVLFRPPEGHESHAQIVIPGEHRTRQRAVRGKGTQVAPAARLRR